MKTIEFFFDVASPYTYMASEVIQSTADRAGAALVWRPFLLGGVFKAVGNQPPAGLPARGRYMLKDLYRWSGHYGVPFRFPSRFPINSLLAMRALAGAPEDQVPALAKTLFRAYWGEDRDISDPAVLTELIGADAVARASDPAVKAALRATTEDAVARGAFGAPTFFVEDQMFFGNDRLMFLEAAARED